MAFHPELLHDCHAELARRRNVRAAELESLRADMYQKIPEIRWIEEEMRAGMLGALREAFGGASEAESAVEQCRERNLALRAKRAQLLVEHDYPFSALDDTPDCPLCADQGHVGGAPCVCLKTLYAKAQRTRMSRALPVEIESFDSFDLERFSSARNPVYGMSPRDYMSYLHEECGKYAERFGPEADNLFFGGGPGTGKTFLCSCIAGELSDRAFWVEYESAIPLLAALEAQKFAREPDEDQTHRFFDCDLLILDDLGSEFLSPFVQSALHHLLTARLNARRKTILCSTLSRDELRRRYTPALWSRLEGEYVFYYLFGDDLRGK